MADSALRDKTAIVGIGATEFSKSSGRSELRLAVESVTRAVAEAGLVPADIDGLVTFTVDNNSEIDVFRAIGGKDLKFFSRINYGGGGTCAALQQAVMAIATGVARVVVCYRAMNERSEYRYGTGLMYESGIATSDSGLAGAHIASGLRTPAACIAMLMRRYMHVYGVIYEDFGRVAVSARRHAATNPNAWFHGKPLTLEDYMASRMIVDPLRLFDCCQESDGAVAIVVTGAEHARDLPQRPVLIRAAAQGVRDDMIAMYSYYREDITSASESRLVAEQLYGMSGLGPSDMDAAILYDHFGPTVLLSLEAYGFCGKGEAKDFIRNGNIEVGGSLPVNTHGGQVGEAYIHGMNGIAEAVRQLRGTAVNQVAGAQNILVTAGLAVPTSGAVLGIDG
jgi:acetyl-CoA acetyltransferase